jgi:putative redox protein
MKVELDWKEKLLFAAGASGHEVLMDARPPLGGGGGMTPKELLLAAVAGCTGMDVAAMLRKRKQEPSSLRISIDATPSEGGHPKVFTKAELTYALTGTVDPEVALKAVAASQTMYCGVSAMLSRALPITYVVTVNGSRVGEGRVDFGEQEAPAR